MRTLTEFAGAIRRAELTFDPHQHQMTRLSPQLGYFWHMKCQENASFPVSQEAFIFAWMTLVWGKNLQVKM